LGTAVPDSHAGASYRNHFFAHEVEPDQFGLLTFLKMAPNGVPHVLVELGEVIGLGENGFSQRARRVAAFGRFLHHENEFGHDPSSALLGLSIRWTFSQPSSIALDMASRSLRLDGASQVEEIMAPRDRESCKPPGEVQYLPLPCIIESIHLLHDLLLNGSVYFQIRM
jgi:hypothetical protein